MTGLDLATWLADAAIIGTYLWLALRGPRRAEVWFHAANAVGAVPLLWVELDARLWQPVALTAVFGIAGVLGVWRWTRGCSPACSEQHTYRFPCELRTRVTMKARWHRWVESTFTCSTCGRDLRAGACGCPEDYSSLH